MSKKIEDQFGKVKLDWLQFKALILEKYSVQFSGAGTEVIDHADQLDTLSDVNMLSEGILIKVFFQFYLSGFVVLTE